MNRMEQDIEKTLQSAERIRFVAPSEQLLNRLKNIPTDVKQGYAMIPKKIVWTIAASIALLIAVNMVALKRYSSTQVQQTTTTNSYFDYLNTL